MKQTFDALLAILDDEIDAYRTMKAILGEEKTSTALSDRTAFLAVGQRKQKQIDTLKQMEHTRQQRVEMLATRLGIDNPKITASLLAKHLQMPQADKLEDRTRTLRRVMDQVQALNNANAQLFSHYLELIHGALKMLNDLVYGHGVYTRPGEASRSGAYGSQRGKVFCGNV